MANSFITSAKFLTKDVADSFCDRKLYILCTKNYFASLVVAKNNNTKNVQRIIISPTKNNNISLCIIWQWSLLETLYQRVNVIFHKPCKILSEQTILKNYSLQVH